MAMATIVILAINLIFLSVVLWEASICSICKTVSSLRHSSTLNRLYTKFAMKVVPNYTLPTLDPLFLSEVCGSWQSIRQMKQFCITFAQSVFVGCPKTTSGLFKLMSHQYSWNQNVVHTRIVNLVDFLIILANNLRIYFYFLLLLTEISKEKNRRIIASS